MADLSFNPLEAAADRFVMARSVGFWDYMGSRGLRRETVDQFRVGFSPRHPLLAQPLEFAEAFLDAGLLCPRTWEKERVLLPLFRGMFALPCPSAKGVCGFTFRDSGLDDTASRYMTLTAKPMRFQPGRVVRPAFYGLPGCELAEESTLLEGHFTMLRVWQASLPTPMAASGLGVRDDTIMGLLERPNTVNLWFDWDASGRRRTLMLALKALRFRREAEVPTRRQTRFVAYPGTLRVVAVDPAQVPGKDAAELPDDATVRQVYEAFLVPAETFVEREVSRGLDARDPWLQRVASSFIETGGCLGRPLNDLTRHLRRRL